MDLRTMPGIGIVTIVLIALLARVYVPWAGTPRGALVRRVSLSLLGRLRMHGIPAAIALAVTAGGWALGVVPSAVAAVVPVAVVALIGLPMTYTLTTEGIMAGRTPLRRWTEFGGVARRRWGVRLQGVTGARGLTVWLSGSRDDDAVVWLLRQLVRGAYQGQVGPDRSGVAAAEVPAVLAARSLEAVRAAGS